MKIAVRAVNFFLCNYNLAQQNNVQTLHKNNK